MAQINSVRAAILYSLTTLFLFVFATTLVWAQTYNVGDRVEVDDTGMGSWIGGVVMPFKPGDITDGVYRVKRDPPYIARDPAGEYAQVIHMRPSSAPAPSAAARSNASGQSYAAPARASAAPARSYAAPANTGSTLAPVAKAEGGSLNPPMSGGLPRIPGTGWMIMGIQKKGEAPKTPKSFGQSLSFCHSGRWSNTRYDLAAGPMGTYTVQGSHLRMISSLDNSDYLAGPMTWRAADQMLIVDSGTYLWYLQLTSLNACGEKK
ncbi:MAG: hypothetical protein K2X77_07285 [Candidatus Obscuribacterales bacterium]|nr:hypothetical protein [Candidatus Obscuribacterales bacterium]